VDLLPSLLSLLSFLPLSRFQRLILTCLFTFSAAPHTSQDHPTTTFSLSQALVASFISSPSLLPPPLLYALSTQVTLSRHSEVLSASLFDLLAAMATLEDVSSKSSLEGSEGDRVSGHFQRVFLQALKSVTVTPHSQGARCDTTDSLSPPQLSHRRFPPPLLASHPASARPSPTFARWIRSAVPHLRLSRLAFVAFVPPTRVGLGSRAKSKRLKLSERHCKPGLFFVRRDCPFFAKVRWQR
jgi:hypothetical protein